MNKEIRLNLYQLEVISWINSFITNYVAKANTTIESVQNYDREEMINYLLSHSLPEEILEILLKKLDNNEPWDCYQEKIEECSK